MNKQTQTLIQELMVHLGWVYRGPNGSIIPTSETARQHIIALARCIRHGGDQNSDV